MAASAPATLTTAQLAQALLADPRVARRDSTVTADLQDAATGRAGTAGAMLNREILLLPTEVARTHSLGISALEDRGRGHSPTSRHYRGAAVDVSYGVHLTGRDAGSRTLAQIAFAMLPAGSGIGQQECGRRLAVPAGWDTFPDSCDHVHVQVPAGG